MKFTTYEKSGAKPGEWRWVLIKKLPNYEPLPRAVMPIINMGGKIYVIEELLFGDVIAPPETVEVEE